MKCRLRNYWSIIALVLLSSCSYLSSEAEKKLNELKSKTDSLDSLINKEMGKVLSLDSIIVIEEDKVRKLDSIINNSASRIDSISREKLKQLEKIME